MAMNQVPVVDALSQVIRHELPDELNAARLEAERARMSAEDWRSATEVMRHRGQEEVRFSVRHILQQHRAYDTLNAGIAWAQRDGEITDNGELRMALAYMQRARVQLVPDHEERERMEQQIDAAEEIWDSEPEPYPIEVGGI